MFKFLMDYKEGNIFFVKAKISYTCKSVSFNKDFY